MSEPTHISETLPEVLADAKATMILQSVSAFYGVKCAAMLSPRRFPSEVLARSVAMYLMNLHTELSLCAIGRAFHRDHSTVIHAIHSISEKMVTDSELTRQILQLERDLMSVSVTGATPE